MANKILKTLTLPNAQGEPVTYELHPEWDNIEGKPESFGSKGNGIFYIEGTQGTYTEDWLGTHEDITEYYPGLTIAYKTPNDGMSGIDNSWLNINSLGWVDIYANSNTYVGNNYPAGSILILVYTIGSNGKGRWELYDKDTKNTAGAQLKPDTKLYLVGSTHADSSSSRNWGRETYANNGVYIGTDNCLYSNGEKVATVANSAKKSQGVYYIEGSGSSIDSWKGTHEDITEYYPGLMIAYKNDKAGGTIGDDTYLNINNLGSVKIVMNASDIYADEKRYPVGSIILLVYTVDSDGKAYWKVSDHDTINTAGASNKVDTKMYLVGCPNYQYGYATTYSNNKVYIGTDNCLYSNGKKVATVADSAKKSQGIYYIEGTQGTSTEDWLGTHEDITEYYSGLVIAYKTPNDGPASINEVQLSINSLGWAYVKSQNGGYIDRGVYPSGSILLLVYTVEDGVGYWKFCDSDTKGYIRKTLIWTNASPTSNFASQKINLNLNPYDAVEIIYAPTLTDYCLMSSGEIPHISGKTSYARLWSATPTVTVSTTIKSLVKVIYSGITFTPSTDDSSVPYKIYGIKYSSY